MHFDNIPLLVIGLISTTFQVLFALSVNRLRLLLFSLGASLLFLVQYALLVQWIGLFSGIAGTTYTLLLALGYRWSWLQSRWLTLLFSGAYLAVFFALVNWDTFQPYQAIPLVAGISMLIALHAKNLIFTKAVMLAAGTLWLTYEFSNTMYTQMLGEGFELIGNAIALGILLRAHVLNRRLTQEFDELVATTSTIPVQLPSPVLDARQDMVNPARTGAR